MRRFCVPAGARHTAEMETVCDTALPEQGDPMPEKRIEDTLLKPAPTRAETKADITDRAARAILEDEVARRREKTAKLRAARLELEARET